MLTFAQKVAGFNQQLSDSLSIPNSFEVLNPYQNSNTLNYCTNFLNKYYNDHNKRVFVLGINPGRLGAGLTGISFTDPIHLSKVCGINNTLDKRPELSSQFIYEVIDAYGGAIPFFNQFFLSSVCPLGFTKGGKNINYYDDRELINATDSYIITAMDKQIEMGAFRQSCICLGEGANFKYLSKINERNHWFKKIYPLAHPRFILQYKRKEKHRYIQMYLDTLDQCVQQL